MQALATSPNSKTVIIGNGGDDYRAACAQSPGAHRCAGGLSVSLQEFDVSVDPDSPARLLRPYRAAAGEWSWSLHDLEAPPGYRATLAASRTAPAYRNPR
jgi:hypothetical protein